MRRRIATARRRGTPAAMASDSPKSSRRRMVSRPASRNAPTTARTACASPPRPTSSQHFSTNASSAAASFLDVRGARDAAGLGFEVERGAPLAALVAMGRVASSETCQPLSLGGSRRARSRAGPAARVAKSSRARCWNASPRDDDAAAPRAARATSMSTRLMSVAVRRGLMGIAPEPRNGREPSRNSKIQSEPNRSGGLFVRERKSTVPVAIAGTATTARSTHATTRSEVRRARVRLFFAARRFRLRRASENFL